MRRIWKAALEFQHDDPTCEVTLPEGFEIVRFRSDPGPYPFNVPTIWAIVDDDRPSATHRFVVYGTGAPLPRHGVYVGTYDAGPFVWHVFHMVGEPLPDGLDLPADAEAAYRTMTAAGFVSNDYRVPGSAAWIAPDDEPLTTELIMAVATLQEYGFGPVVSK